MANGTSLLSKPTSFIIYSVTDKEVEYVYIKIEKIEIHTKINYIYIVEKIEFHPLTLSDFQSSSFVLSK